MSRIDEHNIFVSDYWTYSYNTDSTYHARLEFYFQILQEAAGDHAGMRNASIPELQREGKTWMVVRTHMRIHRYAPWPEQLFLETWGQEGHRLHLPRGTKVVDGQGKPVFEALSQWAVLDMEHNFRPVRPIEITSRIVAPAPDDTEHYYDPALPKRIPYDSTGARELYRKQIEVRYLDTDYNQHVNNVVYINWMLEALPAEFRDAFKVYDVDVSWIRQCFKDDKIEAVVGTLSSDDPMDEHSPQLLHKIIRTSADGLQEVAFEATTKWLPRAVMTQGYYEHQ